MLSASIFVLIHVITLGTHGWGLAQPFPLFQHSGLPRPCHSAQRALCSDRAGNLTLDHNLQHDSQPRPLSRRPLRLDFYHPFRPGKIVTKAAPRPILRFLHEFSFHGIAMDVAQLLNAFGLA